MQSSGRAQDLPLSVSKQHLMIFISVIDTRTVRYQLKSKLDAALLQKNKENNKSRRIVPDLPCWLKSVVGLVRSSLPRPAAAERKTETNKLTKSERSAGNLQCDLQDASAPCWLTGMARGRQPSLPSVNF